MSRIAVIGLVGKSMFFDVPRFHTGGETITARGYYEEWGGKGFNQAVAAARQDAAVAFLGACSAADRKSIEDFCRKEGVAPRMCVKKRATASAAILTDGTGETRVTVYPGAELEAKDVNGFAGSIATADFLLLNNEVPEAVNLAAVEIAKEYGVKIIFNPAPARKLPRAILENVTIFTPNEFEECALGGLRSRAAAVTQERDPPSRAAAVTQERDPPSRAAAVTQERDPPSRAAAVTRERDPLEIVTTLGARGCRIRSTGEVIPAPHVKAVDSTGAGDTFNAVLAVRLAEGESVHDACVAANAAAAQSVAVRYVLPSLPRVVAGRGALLKSGG